MLKIFKKSPEDLIINYYDKEVLIRKQDLEYYKNEIRRIKNMDQEEYGYVDKAYFQISLISHNLFLLLYFLVCRNGDIKHFNQYFTIHETYLKEISYSCERFMRYALKELQLNKIEREHQEPILINSIRILEHASLMIMGGDSPVQLMDSFNLNIDNARDKNSIHLLHCLKHYIQGNIKELNTTIDQAKNNILISKEYLGLIELVRLISVGESINYQQTLNSVIENKKRSEAKKEELTYKIWPTLWAICILAKKNGLQFEIDCSFMPKSCLEWY